MTHLRIFHNHLCCSSMTKIWRRFGNPSHDRSLLVERWSSLWDTSHTDSCYRPEWQCPSMGLGASMGNSLSLLGTHSHDDYHWHFGGCRWQSCCHRCSSLDSGQQWRVLYSCFWCNSHCSTRMSRGGPHLYPLGHFFVSSSVPVWSHRFGYGSLE